MMGDQYFPYKFPEIGPHRFANPGLAGDSVAPTVVITSSETSPTAAATIPITMTFSEEVSGFVVGDITVGNGTAGNFATADNIVFTADITPTAAGDVTVDIGAGVCTDLAGNDNEAATQFSIIALVGGTGLWDANLSPLYEDAGTTPAVDNNDLVYRIGGLVSSRHLDQATSGLRPLLKLSEQNSKNGITYDGADDYHAGDIMSTFITNSAFTIFTVHKPISIATNAAQPYQNDPVLCDAGGWMGLHLKNNAGTCTAIAYVWDGGAKTTPAVSSTLGEPVVLTWWLDSGTMYLQKNDDAAVSVGSVGTLSDITNALRIAKPVGSIWSNITFYHARTAQTVLGAPARADIIAALMSYYGVP